MSLFSPRGGPRTRRQLVGAGATTAFALGLLAVLATGSLVAGAVMFGLSAICVVAVLAWVARRERESAAALVVLSEGALWSGSATIRVRDLLDSPLLDTVRVRRPGRARRRSSQGAVGTLVVGASGLTWAARWDGGGLAFLGLGAGVQGSFVLPWTSVVRAQAAAIPTATPGSGAIALVFADDSKLDIALAGNYPAFRAALTLLPHPLPGLGD
jgi:hypothetical protein